MSAVCRYCTARLAAGTSCRRPACVELVAGLPSREPFSGRFFGIFNVEGDGPEPVAMFRRRASAETYLAARRALDVDHDDYLPDFFQVFPLDAVGAWWNSYDPDPRADNPLAPEETIAAYMGSPS